MCEPTPEMWIAHLNEQINTLLREKERVVAERDDAREQRRRWHEASVADRAESARLRAKINTVLETFERDEAQGYHSKDRQFAISILKHTA